MGSLLSYSIAVSIFLIPLYLTIRLLMGGLTFYALTRFTMLAALIASLLLPFAVGPIAELLSTPVAPQVEGYIEIGTPMVAVVADAIPSPSTPLALRIFLAIYSLGLAFFIVREVIGIFRLTMIIRSARRIGKYGGYTILAHSDCALSPFSFGRYIVVPDSEIPVDRSILIHESAHLARRHWADLILADAVAILCWWNPAAWLMRRDLAVVHEYEADDAVLASGARASDYQIMLIKKAAGSRFPSIACSLSFHSNISKRIKMMLRKKSRPALRIAALAALPVAVMSFAALSIPAVANALSAVSDAKVTNFSPADQNVAPESAPESASVTPDAPVGVVRVVRGAAANTTPDKEPLIIIDGATADRAKLESLSPEAIESITILKDEASKANYGEEGKNGVMVVTTKAAAAATAQAPNDPQQKKVFDAVDVMPQYPGGDGAMMMDISRSLRYPKECVEDSIQGRVIVQFVVEPDCTVGEVKVLRSVDPRLDAEAIRVAKQLKFESPAMVGGKPVSVWYTLPLTFKLTDSKAPAPKKTEISPDAVFEMPETMPVYSSTEGDAAMFRFLAMNLRYPEECVKNDIQGRSIITFRINKDGSISDMKVTRSAGNELLDNEAMRVISLMKFEKPGMVKGEPINCMSTLPVMFKLSSDDAKTTPMPADVKASADETLVVGYGSKK